mgnify:CR=1 FL=1
MKNIQAQDALPTVRLKIERKSNHPWIFQKMVEKPEPKPRPGTIVEIYDRDGQFCGRGFYNGHSRISLRVLSEDPDEAIDDDLVHGKKRGAASLVRAHGGDHAVVHGIAR